MKISVVMQSYLHDYPDSRTRPKEKFVRAVNSFLGQTHLDKELIIVADGCDITQRMYESIYADNELIKFAYITKPKAIKRMYESEVNEETLVTYYRGMPRRIGCSMAQGDLITYFDTDDIMLPSRLADIAKSWANKDRSTQWSSNPLRLVHSSAVVFSSDPAERAKQEAGAVDLRAYGIADKFYHNSAVKDGMICGASYSLVHRRDVAAQWADSVIVRDKSGKIISGTNEDAQLLDDLMKVPKSGFIQKSATIAICHYRGKWDV